ncbi:hypothetical protein NAC44_18035 [Allorhizobium sp. BGMRC 0089]|uniref:hypothetical protein n=1 Tax=Allorhizobium sonneratiae TaxID=2934936 RepID=UPI00203493A1|nr:hypothetical protein [Allorhizobium sonneratiae]MCM2294230.1 hypothetical protein [Allorhizobium sonneratiae]
MFDENFFATLIESGRIASVKFRAISNWRGSNEYFSQWDIYVENLNENIFVLARDIAKILGRNSFRIFDRQSNVKLY